MTTKTVQAPTSLTELVEVLRQLPAMAPVQRARTARSLAGPVRAILADVGEGAIFEAVNSLDGVRKVTHAEVAAELGVVTTTVTEAVTRYRKRHGGQ